MLLVAFAAGLGVGTWKPHAIRTLMVRLGLQDRVFDDLGPYQRSRLAEGIDWRELFPDARILNRGISGDTSAGVLQRLDEVIGRRPKIVFLMIGSNDLQMGLPVSAVNANIRSIVRALEERQIRVVLQKVLFAASGYRPQINNKVNELNHALADLCRAPTVLCLDLNHILANGGALSPSFSLDGLHLNTAGYLAWKSEITALLPP